jgi:hypothetical protein
LNAQQKKEKKKNMQELAFNLVVKAGGDSG